PKHDHARRLVPLVTHSSRPRVLRPLERIAGRGWALGRRGGIRGKTKCPSPHRERKARAGRGGAQAGTRVGAATSFVSQGKVPSTSAFRPKCPYAAVGV